MCARELMCALDPQSSVTQTIVRGSLSRPGDALLVCTWLRHRGGGEQFMLCREIWPVTTWA